MSKKLLIAVLTLGLMFALSGVAFPFDEGTSRDNNEPVTRNPNTPQLSVSPEQDERAQSHQFNRPMDPPSLKAITPVRVWPPDAYCANTNYLSPAGTFAYYWYEPEYGYGSPMTYNNMRFTTAAGYYCTLVTASIGLDPANFIGTPDLDVIVWDDDGFGNPNLAVERGRVTVPFASLITTMGWQSVDLRPFNIVYTGEVEYHIGISCPNEAGGANVIAFMSDEGAVDAGRLSFLYLGGWYSWTGGYNYAIDAEICTADIPYSSCDFRKHFNIIDDWWYMWRIPNTYPMDYYNNRFTAEGPETLMAFGLAIANSTNPTSLNKTTGDMDVFIVGGPAGFPDLSNVIYETTIPLGDMTFVNITGDSTEVDISAENIVVIGDYFIGYSDNAASGGTVVGTSDNGSFGALIGSAQYGGDFYLMNDLFGTDFGFIIYSRTCKDEFSLCQTYLNAINNAGQSTLPTNATATGIQGMFQGFESIGLGCRLDKLSLALNTGTVDQYTYNSLVQVYDEDANLLAEVTLTPADYKFWPEWTVVDFNALNVRFDGVIYAGVRSLAPDAAHGIILFQENPYSGGLGSLYQQNGGGWFLSVRNRYIKAEVCCIPLPERVCTPGEDWPTCAHDFRRSAASFNSTGDAKCKQAVAWQYTDAAGFFFNRPVIYGDILLAAYNTKLMAFDINVGAPALWTITGMPYIGSGFRNSVTVKDGYVYFGGGNAANLTKADVLTGVVAWSTAVGGLNGNTSYTTSVILDVAGEDIIFFGTSEGGVYARKCSDGTAFTDWTVNPVIVGGDVWSTLSSNGVDKIYVGDDGKFGRGYGSINCIDAATGDIDWTLDETTLAGIALDGDTLGDVTLEIFQSPIAVDEDGMLYVMSSFASEVDGAPSGVRYKIDDGGTIVWAVNGKWQGTTSTVQGFTSPVIDANAIFCQSLRGWTSETTGLEAVDKLNGEVIWTVDPFWTTSGYVEGALSCETLARDILYTANNGAQFLAINADTGNVLFKYDYAPGTGSVRGCGTAIDPTHVVFTDRRGDVFVMTEQVDRARLNILVFNQLQSVPFFSPDPHPVTFTDVFENMGCINLNGSLSANSTPSAADVVVTSVNPRRMDRMADVADNMVNNSYKDMAKKIMPVKQDFEESAYSKESYSNMSAYLPPAWFIDFTFPTFDIAPGETFDVQYTVHGPLVTRGPHLCYITITSNDQFFLNSTGRPVIQLGVLGGCLETTTEMVFGTTDQNIAPIASTGEMGNQDVTHWDIDGADAWYWQGGLVFGMSQHRLAFNLEGWSSADAANLWNLTLPDINCFDQCEPYVTPDLQTLGAMTHDGGLTYDAVQGYVAVNQFIDSLLQLDCAVPGTWNWKGVTCPFSNDSTMGLLVKQTIYGVSGEAALNGVVIYRTDVTERNGRALPGVYFGAIQDYDLEANAFDVARFDAAHSVAWAASCSGVDVTSTIVAGMGKIPMDIEPMIGARVLDADQAMWSTNSAAGLDSMYLWMTTQPGLTYQAGIDINLPCASGSGSSDREIYFSLVGHSFAANETYTFGYYQFAFADGDATDPAAYIELATVVNQLAGFGRGDINNDAKVNLVDVVALYNMLHAAAPGPRFQHLADVNNDTLVNDADVLYLANYWFCAGPKPVGSWVLPQICP